MKLIPFTVAVLTSYRSLSHNIRINVIIYEYFPIQTIEEKQRRDIGLEQADWCHRIKETRE
jgi:hypothetical protein